jgi:hypothetical protein
LQNLYYFPASNKIAQKNLSKSIFKKVDLNEYSHLGDVQQHIEELGSKVNLWGLSEGRFDLWRGINYGDKIVIYSKGAFLVSATISYKFRSSELSKAIWDWDSHGDGDWENIIVLSDLKPIYISREKFNKAIGYSSLYYPRGFNKVRSDRIYSEIREYGSLDNFLESMSEDIKLNSKDLKQVLNTKLTNNMMFGKWAKSNLFNRITEKLDLTDDLLKQIVFSGGVSYKSSEDKGNSRNIEKVVESKVNDIERLKRESPEIIDEVQKINRIVAESQEAFPQINNDEPNNGPDNEADDGLDEVNNEVPEDTLELMFQLQEQFKSTPFKISVILQVVLLLMLYSGTNHQDEPEEQLPTEQMYPVETYDGITNLEEENVEYHPSNPSELRIGSYTVINNDEAKEVIAKDEENKPASNE